MTIAGQVAEAAVTDGHLLPSDAREIHAYLESHFDRALLLLGDLTPPLLRHTRIWVARESVVCGVAGVFRGFRLPVVVVVGSTEDAGARLLAECEASLDRPGILVCRTDDPIAARVERF
ncbi:MAG: hypothetical protein M3P41_04705, partial [Actinomycetota bacterium]|nr:hypothetical protein [Actinomycetota bacterium]